MTKVKSPNLILKSLLFQDSFEVSDVDPHGKKFDRGTSDTLDMELTLDVNTEIYPIEASDKFTLVLAASLSDSATDKEPWRDVPGQKTLADEYDYVMFGKVYKYDDTAGARVYVYADLTIRAVYASFGGLLMCLAGDYRHLQQLNVGDALYLLLRK